LVVRPILVLQLAVYLGAFLAPRDQAKEGLEVTSQDPPFLLRLPEFYAPRSTPSPGGSLAYRRLIGGDPNRIIDIVLTSMPKGSCCPYSTPEEVEAAQLKTASPGLHSRLSTLRWRGILLGVQEDWISGQGFAVLMLTVHVPLIPRPIHITFTGLQPEEGNIRKDLESTLGTLNGSTSWVALHRRELLRWRAIAWAVVPLFGLELVFTLISIKRPSRAGVKIRSALLMAIALILLGYVALFIVLMDGSPDVHRWGEAVHMVPMAFVPLFLIYRVMRLKELGVLTEGQIHLKEGRYEQALLVFEHGLRRWPHSHLLKHNRAFAQMLLGRYSDAKEQLLGLLEQESMSPWLRPYVLNNVAFCTILMPDRSEHLEEANRWSSEALRLNGSNATLKATRGSVLVELGQYEEGLHLLNDSVCEKGALPRSKAVRAAYIALALQRQGKIQEANAFREQARSIDPRCPVLARFDENR